MADLELTWENFDNFSAFDIDFSFNTVPGTSRDVRDAFQAMQGGDVSPMNKTPPPGCAGGRHRSDEATTTGKSCPWFQK